MIFLPFSFLLLSFSKHRCDGWSYSGDCEAILRTKATCQGQQAKKTKVAWDVVATVETPYGATQPTVDFFYVRECVPLSYLNPCQFRPLH